MDKQAGKNGGTSRSDRQAGQAGETGRRDRQARQVFRIVYKERDGWTGKRGKIGRNRQARRAGWKEGRDKQE